MKLAALKNVYVAVGALLAWFAVLLQLVLILQNSLTPVLETLFRYFTFFTILTNILVAICFASLWYHRKNPAASFFTPGRQTAVAVYILVVGIVYNLALRSLWQPQGAQRLVDELLHVVVPVWYFIYWFVFVSKQGLEWKNAVSWLLYPFVYLVVILVRGALAPTPYYPYPFVDASKIGYEKVAINSFFVLLLFLLLSFLFIGIGKWSRRAVQSKATG
ncbi:MAG: hypothetical protein EOO03_01405 [Chitinophagaceae bacterium]|nr:MAG: hypothetical protein EOO03_01405 [Chitinophagaceae bacterium]